MSSNRSFSEFNARLREFIEHSLARAGVEAELAFNRLALDLFALQFEHNAPYRRFCEERNALPGAVEHWTRIPAIPTAAFKEFELSCLQPGERTAVFYSSGTTAQRRSRHLHCADSLAVYEASLLPWFARHLLEKGRKARMLVLTPPPAEAPNSSLAHMFQAVVREFGTPDSVFVGQITPDGIWALDMHAALKALDAASRSPEPALVLGTAFSFVHLLDQLEDQRAHFKLPAGSRVLETGGYKGRSRHLPKNELHSLITQHLGVPDSQLVCEYGMSELSSQAYDKVAGSDGPARWFRFPPWARARLISPESGDQAGEGRTGLIQVFDLANAYSVMAIQTEDLGVRRGDGFELLGRAALAEPRGCSLMAV